MSADQPFRGERHWRRFVVAAMLNPLTLPALGGSILVAVALGIHLGESSIGLINPIYFQGPALHPRERGVAIDENAVRPREVSYSQLYGWDEGRTARAADCGNCEALQARDAYVSREAQGYSAEVPYFGSREELRADDRRERAELRALEAAAEERFAARTEMVDPHSPVLRYAYYPVEEPPVEELPAEAEKFYEE